MGENGNNPASKETTYVNVEIHEEETGKIVASVCQALKERGYNPINQIVGYIMSGDPTYITSHNGARALITKIERDELLEYFVAAYLSKK